MTEKEKKKQLRQERIDKFLALSGKNKWQFFKDYYLKGTIICFLALIMLSFINGNHA